MERPTLLKRGHRTTAAAAADAADDKDDVTIA
jgi:hypothetical protein